jgi:hypothetical protein
MMTQRSASMLGMAAIGLMGLLLVLVWFRLVPQSWDLPLFLAAIVIFSLRLALRTRYSRREGKNEKPPDVPPAAPGT